MKFSKYNTPIILLIYLFCWYLAKLTNQEWLLGLPGLFLIYYLPGNQFNSLIKLPEIHWFGKIALDITSSISIVYITHLFCKKLVLYKGGPLTYMVIGLNLFLWLVSFFAKKRSKEKVRLYSKKVVILAVAIPLVAFVIRLVLNPYIYEIDSGLYLDVYKEIIQTGQDNSFLSGLRNGFSLFMVLSKYVSGIGFIGFFKFVTPFLFYLSSLILLEICINIKNQLTSLLCYLLFLAVPIIPIMNEGVRPETFILVLTFPIFFLIYKALKDHNLIMLLVAFIYSIVSFRFHEFGIFLILATSLAMIIFLMLNSKRIVKLIKNKLWLSILFIVPYLILIKQNIVLFISQISTGIFKTTFNLIEKSFINFHWDWWFIDNYTAVDGGKIGWPGLSFIFYYLYNGITVLILLIIIVVTIIKFRVKNKEIAIDHGRKIWFVLPIIIFLLVYFSFAEVMPRMGVFILPNRAWPHIMMSAVFLVAVALVDLQKKGYNFRLINTLLLLCVVSGVFGTIIGSTYMGSVVTPSEKSLIKELRKLPRDSIITSSQPNKNLVEMYGKLDYAEVGPIDVSKIEDFDQIVNDKMLEVMKTKNCNLFQDIIFEKNINMTTIFNGQVVEQKHSSTFLSNENALSLLKEYDPVEYNYINEELVKNNQAASRPIYFLYSFEKFSGIMSKRQWWLVNNDFENLKNYKELSFAKTVYKGKDGIIIKIK